MELLLHVTMALNDGFIPEYLLILLTTRKSESRISLEVFFLMESRVLLATIRDNGLCPCPRCLMPKTHLDRLGWILDSAFRITNIRHCLHKKVQAARDLVYRLGHATAGAGVNGLLKLTSSVPTVVSDVPPTQF